MKKKYPYDIAISFASADHNIALCIYLALKLEMPESSIYYYPKKQSVMLGNDLKKELNEIYRHQSAFVIAVVSRDYIDVTNDLVQCEINAYMPRFLMEKSAYVIPAIVDKTKLKELHEELDGITHFMWDFNPEKLVLEIKKIMNDHVETKPEASNVNEEKSTTSKEGKESKFKIKGNTFKENVQIGDNNIINKTN